MPKIVNAYFNNFYLRIMLKKKSEHKEPKNKDPDFFGPEERKKGGRRMSWIPDRGTHS